MYTPWYFFHQLLLPQRELQLPSASPGDPPRPEGRFGPGSYEVTAVHEILCVLLKSRFSDFPDLMELLKSSHTGLQSQILWDSSSWCHTSRLGSLSWGSELSLLLHNFCDIIILQFVSYPWWGIGRILDYIMTMPLLFPCCGFFFHFGYRLFFW